MDILREFTNAVVNDELAQHPVQRGYKAAKGRIYDTYLDNASWEALLCGMSRDHRIQYASGGGKELEERDGRPPKMAAFVSSSRMIYGLSKDITDFRFEEKLPTIVGGAANLDGCLIRESTRWFVEAKCREPYSHREVQTIKLNYRPVYEYLQQIMPHNFSCTMEEAGDGRSMRTVFFCNGEPVASFDIKQMICHLLAIAAKMLRENCPAEQIRFLYLLYNPCHLELSQESRDAVLRIYAQTCKAANGYRFGEMFGHIVDYLVQEENLHANADAFSKLKRSFRFTLCDQHDYRALLEI